MNCYAGHSNILLFKGFFMWFRYIPKLNRTLIAYKKTPVPSLILTLALLFGLVSVPTIALSETLTIDSAINKAGRQRMLTQRIVKSYLLIGQDVSSDTAQEQLDSSIGLFEQQLEELEEFSPNQTISKSLSEVRAQWNTFRLTAISKPEKRNATNLINEGQNTLDKCEKVVRLLEKHSGNQKGKLINISGRQRMLSQRIGMFYVAKSWNINSNQIDTAFTKAISEYDQALKTLSLSKLNTEEINSALEKVNAQWEFSRSGFEQIENSRYVPFIIQVTTESMLKKMNKITGMYEALTKDSIAKI